MRIATLIIKAHLQAFSIPDGTQLYVSSLGQKDIMVSLVCIGQQKILICLLKDMNIMLNMAFGIKIKTSLIFIGLVWGGMEQSILDTNAGKQLF